MSSKRVDLASQVAEFFCGVILRVQTPRVALLSSACFRYANNDATIRSLKIQRIFKFDSLRDASTLLRPLNAACAAKNFLCKTQDTIGQVSLCQEGNEIYFTHTLLAPGMASPPALLLTTASRDITPVHRIIQLRRCAAVIAGEAFLTGARCQSI